MTLFEQWRDAAYGEGTTAKQKAKLWKDYFDKEKEIYKQLLSDINNPVSGTIKDLAAKFDTDVQTMMGFLDGIDESIKKSNNLEKAKETTKVKLEIVPESLYKNMVKAKADWLYGLEEWNAIFTPERQTELLKEQRMSGTVVKEKKIGRNDPCPCGSGKKYKYCCGRNA